MVKKFLSLMVASVMILGLVGCAKSEDVETPVTDNTEEVSSSDEVTDVPEEAMLDLTTYQDEVSIEWVYPKDKRSGLLEQPIITSKDIVITVDRYVENERTCYVDFTVEHSTNKELTVEGCEETSAANGIWQNFFFGQTEKTKDTSKFGLWFYKNKQTMIGIDDVREVTFKLIISDEESNTSFDTGIITIKTSKYNTTEPRDYGEPVVDCPYMNVYKLGPYEYKDGPDTNNTSPAYNFIVENKTDKKIKVAVESLSINGFNLNIKPVFLANHHIKANIKELFALEIDKEVLRNDVNIPSIDSITLYFGIYDTETRELLYTTPEFTVDTSDFEYEGYKHYYNLTHH